MSFLDRFARKREPEATAWNWSGGTSSGYLFSGGKFSGAAMYPSLWKNANAKLREQSRAAYWDSTQGRAIISRIADSVIGTGLVPEASPVWDLIGGPDAEEIRHKVTREIEQRFRLWAESNEPDATEGTNFFGLQMSGFVSLLKDGELFTVLKYSKDGSRMSPLAIQFLNPDQVCTPTDTAKVKQVESQGRRILDGIEVDRFGKMFAIWAVNEKSEFERIPVIAEAGRRFVVHTKIGSDIGNVRGVPLLAPLVHELKKITDGTVAELEAMVINALIAVWVKPSPDKAASKALAGIAARGANAAQYNTQTDGETTSVNFDKPGLIVQSLKAGEEAMSFDTKRPNVNFPEFTRQITKALSASVSVPIEVLEESFNANYSASRASLLLFWKSVEIWRGLFVAQFLGPIYESWFSEEVKNGRIKAAGFDASPVMRRAWLNCVWNGDKLPSIDPLKEANADGVRLAQGATTHEKVAMEYSGTDFTENAERLKIENALLAGAAFVPDPETPEAPEQ